MSDTSKTQKAAAAEAEQVSNPQDVNAGATQAEVPDFSFDQIMGESNAGETREDIIRRCIADKKSFKLLTGLNVKNVKAFVGLSKASNRSRTRLTFITKESIPGMVKDESTLDAFGDPMSKLGATNNVFVSSYAVAGAMKETAKGALFADEVAKMTAILTGSEEIELVGKQNIANILYAGGKIDVLCQFVPANTEYVNPFGKQDENAEATVFEEDRIMHHIVRLQLGEVGNDYYRAVLLG